MPHSTSNSSWFHHQYNIWWGVQMMCRSSLCCLLHSPCYLVPIQLKAVQLYLSEILIGALMETLPSCD
jgi:hypothetical protein